MKKSKLLKTNLVLAKETIRGLSANELAEVAGGDPASALCPTRRFACPSLGCP